MELDDEIDAMLEEEVSPELEALRQLVEAVDYILELDCEHEVEICFCKERAAIRRAIELIG